jgi:acylphosphatase
VQAVGFRAWLVRRADQRRLDGWVRNLPDGSLEAVLAGPGDAVAAMVEQVRRGPPGAWVEDLDVREEPDDPGPGFRLR